MRTWSRGLYQNYVTSGQAGDIHEHPSAQFAGRRAYLLDIIHRHFPSDRHARILDIGCGHGALLYFLAREGYDQTVGVDWSQEQVDLGQRLGIANIRYGNGMEFLNAQEVSSTDAVCLFDVLEHLSRQEACDLIAQTVRVVRPGGRVIGHVPNGEGLFGMSVRYGDLTHEQAFTRQSLRQLFRSHGFSSVQCWEDKPVVHGPTSLIRRALWDFGTIPFRVLLAAERGGFGAILSENCLFVAMK